MLARRKANSYVIALPVMNVCPEITKTFSKLGCSPGFISVSGHLTVATAIKAPSSFHVFKKVGLHLAKMKPS